MELVAATTNLKPQTQRIEAQHSEHEVENHTRGKYWLTMALGSA